MYIKKLENQNYLQQIHKVFQTLFTKLYELETFIIPKKKYYLKNKSYFNFDFLLIFYKKVCYYLKK